MSKTLKPQLDPLTSLRFFAAFGVVIHHLLGWYGMRELIRAHLGTGGVSFFFILSGFILSYTYEGRGKDFDIPNFFRKRVARIYPLHIVTLLAVIFFTTKEISNLDIWANAFGVHSWLPSYRMATSANGPSWSISTELFFYLFFPILIAFRNNLSLILIMFAAIAFIWFAAMVDATCIPDSGGASRDTCRALKYTFPIARIPEFILGIVIRRIFSGKFNHLVLSKSTATILEVIVVVIVYIGLTNYSIVKSLFGNGYFTAYITNVFGRLFFPQAILLGADIDKGFVFYLNHHFSSVACRLATGR